jgi:hypothetical protein
MGKVCSKDMSQSIPEQRSIVERASEANSMPGSYQPVITQLPKPERKEDISLTAGPGDIIELGL